MTAPHVLKSELGEVKAWINHKAANAIRQVDECVRFVEMLRSWMAYEQHLPAVHRTSGEAAEGGKAMHDGTRVTFGGDEDDRELSFGGDEAASGGSETGGGN